MIVQPTAVHNLRPEPQAFSDIEQAPMLESRLPVYRAEGTGAFVRIATVQPITALYTDRDVQSGRTYRYAVTALDRARKANESARSNEVSVPVP